MSTPFAQLVLLVSLYHAHFKPCASLRSFAGESLERERFQDHVGASYQAGLSFASAKSWFEASNRGAIHASLLALYAWGGWLVSAGLMPLRVMISAIGFTFSLTYATQGIVNTLSELRRASGALSRVGDCADAAAVGVLLLGTSA